MMVQEDVPAPALAGMGQQGRQAHSFDLAGMAQALPNAVPDDDDGHVGLNIAGDSSNETCIQHFLNEDYDELRQTDPGDLLDKLAAHPATLHQLLVLPEEDVASPQAPAGSSGARAGNTNDFSPQPVEENESDTSD